MLNIKMRLNNLINIAREKTEAFVYSYFFPVITTLVCFLFWTIDLQIIGFAIISLMACFVFIVYDDFLPIIPFIIIIPMCFRDTSELFSSTLVPCIVICSVLLLAIIFHLIKYNIKITLDKYFYLLLCVACALLVGGLFSGKYSDYFQAIDVLLIATILPITIHFFFYNKIKLNDKIDYRRYFCFSFISAVTLACMQLCYTYCYIKLMGKWSSGEMPGGFCWANSNHVANLILLAVPLCCYMMTSTKRIWAWFIELVFLYVSIFLSHSDGGLATLVVFTPFLMYALYQNSYRHNRQFLRYAYFAIIALGILALAYFALFMFDELVDFVVSASSSNGRSSLYTAALECFGKRPIFGVGFGNGKLYLETHADVTGANGLFHSTFFHVLACAGIVGVIVYVVYYIERVKCLANGNTLLGYFSLLSLYMFGVYGIVENNEFNIVLMFMTTIITVVGLINKKGSDNKPLPLYISIPSF